MSTDVQLSVNADGSGKLAVEIRLDEAAAAGVPDLAEQLRKGDLGAAGWDVDGPNKDDSGETVITVSHGFANPAVADALMAQLTGTDGPFKNFHLSQTRSFARNQTTFVGTVDLTRGVDSFGDAELQKRFGFPLGLDTAEIQKSLGVDYAQTFPIAVTVHVPGDREVNEPAVDETLSWHPTYGQETSLKVQAKGYNTKPLISLFGGLCFLIGAIAVALVWKSDKYRPAHRRNKDGVRARDLLRGDDAGFS